LNRDEIQQLIPHRPPFLWLDEVVEVGWRQIVARKYVDPELDVFRGHYPGLPVLPGVLQLEAAFQAGAVLIAATESIEAGQVPVVTRVGEVKFRRMVRPGETLMIEVELKEKLGGAWFLAGKVSVDGQVSARLEFACTATSAAMPENPKS
jgi:3-hydroxyacyl-[acyl-carrier-protein] dehydratase